MGDWLGDPIVIDPPEFNDQAAWKECRDEVDRCGGMTYEDGNPNWRAAFSADPGVCSCPCCGAMYWAWGRVQECRACHFRYPTDWWPMYSYGASAGRLGDKLDHLGSLGTYTSQQRMKHKYFRWAYENKPKGGIDGARLIKWREIFPEDAAIRFAAGQEDGT